MKQGYARVSDSSKFSPGKLKKMRCMCNDRAMPGSYSNSGRIAASYFDHGETGHLDDKCPICNFYIWHTVAKGECTIKEHTGEPKI